MRSLGILALFALFLAWTCGNAKEEMSGSEVRVPPPAAVPLVRLPGGDWGLPSPFTFYPRGPGYMHLSLVYDTLTWKDRNGHIPWLAERWEIYGDGSVWSFTLRSGLKWHDGWPVTARDAVFTFEYLKRHPVEWFPVDLVDRIEAPESLRVVFHLKRPFVPFIDQVAGNVPIIPGHIWGTVTDPGSTSTLERLVGSGPYRLVRYDKTQGAYEYEANEVYFLGRPTVGQLLFLPVGDRVVALQRGAVDVSDVPVSLASQLREHSVLKIISGPASWVLKLQFNRDHPLLSMIAARQAVAHAVDREELIRRAVPGGTAGAKTGSPGLIPPDSPWYDQSMDGLYRPNREKARELLASLELSDRDGDGFWEDHRGRPLRLTLLCPPQSLREGEVLKLMLAEAGLSLDVKVHDQKTLDGLVKRGSFDLALFGHGGVGGDPSIVFGFGLAGNVSATGIPTSLEYAAFARSLESTVDPAQRRAISATMQRLYAAELPCLALYYPLWLHAYDPRVFSGWFHTGAGGIATGIPSVYNKLAFVKGESEESGPSSAERGP